MARESQIEREVLSRLKEMRHFITGLLVQCAVLVGISWFASRLINVSVFALLSDVLFLLNLGISPKRAQEGKAALEKVGKGLTRTGHGASHQLYGFRVRIAAFLYRRRLHKQGEPADLSRTQQVLLQERKPDGSAEGPVAQYDPRWAYKISSLPPDAQYRLVGHLCRTYRYQVAKKDQALAAQRENLENYITVPARLEKMRLKVRDARARLEQTEVQRDLLAIPSGFEVGEAKEAVGEAKAQLNRRDAELEKLNRHYFQTADFPPTKQATKRYYRGEMRKSPLPDKAAAVAASYENLERVTQWIINSSGQKIGSELRKTLLRAVKEAEPSLHGSHELDHEVDKAIRALVSFQHLPFAIQQALKDGTPIRPEKLFEALLQQGDFVSDYYCRLASPNRDNAPSSRVEDAVKDAAIELIHVHCPGAQLIGQHTSPARDYSALLDQNPSGYSRRRPPRHARR